MRDRRPVLASSSSCQLSIASWCATCPDKGIRCIIPPFLLTRYRHMAAGRRREVRYANEREGVLEAGLECFWQRKEFEERAIGYDSYLEHIQICTRLATKMMSSVRVFHREQPHSQPSNHPANKAIWAKNSSLYAITPWILLSNPLELCIQTS